MPGCATTLTTVAFNATLGISDARQHEQIGIARMHIENNIAAIASITTGATMTTMTTRAAIFTITGKAESRGIIAIVAFITFGAGTAITTVAAIAPTRVHGKDDISVTQWIPVEVIISLDCDIVLADTERYFQLAAIITPGAGLTILTPLAIGNPPDTFDAMLAILATGVVKMYRLIRSVNHAKALLLKCCR